jgi:hypothetical protein
MEKKIVYFEEKGEKNTDETLRLAKERALELGIRYIVVASTSGETGRKAIEVFKGSGVNVVVVSHQMGFKEKNRLEMKEENRKFIEENARLVMASDIFTTVPKLIQKYGGFTPYHIIADTLRLFSQGMKVCVEIAVMASDAGAIPTDEEVVAIAGTARGADTAVVLKPANIHRFFEIDIKEIICMPRDK